MNPYLKALFIVAAVAGLYVPSTALAQKSGGGVVGEARLHPGTWGNQRSSRSGMRSRPMYRNTAPVIVRSERAPQAVAQAPAERRSFSYEPAQQTEMSRSSGGGCGGSVITEERASATAQRSTETRRSFSYEPSMSDTRPATRDSYSAPRTQSRSNQSSRRPAYLLPKSDPRRYSGRL